MATVTLDTIQDSQIERLGNQQIRAVRGGYVTGVTSTNDPEQLLYEAATATGMPPMGDEYPAYPYSFLTRIRVLGITPRGARILLYYEPFSGVVDTTYIITTGSRMQSYQTNLHPGTLDPLQVGYVDPSAIFDSPPPDMRPISLLKPCATVSVYRLQAGTLSDADQATLSNASVGWVNDDTWMGRAKGHWLCTGCEVTNSKFGGYYSIRATAETNGPVESWAKYITFYQSQIGKWLNSSGLAAAIAASVSGDAYSYGSTIPSGGAHLTDGWRRVCPYPELDFGALFGFTGS